MMELREQMAWRRGWEAQEIKTLEAKKEMTVGVIPIREAQKAVWELWEVAWQVLKDPDGSHTTHFSSVSLIKERAIEIRDKLARGEQV